MTRTEEWINRVLAVSGGAMTWAAPPPGFSTCLKPGKNARYARSFIVPIPGTGKLQHLQENIEASNVVLTAEDLKEISSALSNLTGSLEVISYIAMQHGTSESKGSRAIH